MRRNSIPGQWAWRTIAMMESPAFRVLSLSARRILDRLEIEVAHHGGNDNGKLPCTYDHFEEYGIHRHAIAPAIREAAALGFIEVTEQGLAGNREYRRPNLFRLTYRPVGRSKPTDEWKRFRTEPDAMMAANAARKNNFTVAVSAKSQCGNRHRKPDFHSTETTTTGHSAETITTSIFLGSQAYAGSRRLGLEISTDPLAVIEFHASSSGKLYEVPNESPTRKRLKSRMNLPPESGCSIRRGHYRAPG